VSRSMTVTAAPGTAAFVESVTCPRMALVVSPCPHESVGTSEMAVMVKKVRWSARRSRRLDLDLTANPSWISGPAKGGSVPHPEIRIHHVLLTVVNSL
jgi:hypothetical protein